MACSGWCPPTIIYAILATVAVLFSVVHPDAQTTGERVGLVLAHAASGILWTAVLYWLCSICYEGWAWFFLLLPLILLVVFMILLSTVVLSAMRSGTPSAPGAGAKPKEGMSNYPINDTPYTALGIENPAVIDNVCQFKERPAKFLDPANNMTMGAGSGPL